MEADWEFEVGSDAEGLAAPVIEAHWAGFVNLQRHLESARDLPESVLFPALAEALARLNAVPLRCCRADLVIRRAFIPPDLMELGVTAYLTSCGESPAAAAKTLEAALATFTDALGPTRR
jgi:hypothetical protein